MYNIVTGLRRSGTSMIMLALKEMGMPIIGTKFDNAQSRKLQEEGNPNGYWEVDGVTDKDGLLTKHVNIGKRGDVIKVMSEVLFKSDPTLISKVLVVLRRPRNILSSWLKHNETHVDLFLAQCVSDLVDTFGFLLKHKKEFEIVLYENILKNPKREIKKISEYFCIKDYKKGASVIDKKLNRSEAYNKKSQWIDFLEDIYTKSMNNEIMEILKLEEKLKTMSEELVI